MIEVALYSRDRTLLMQRLADCNGWQQWFPEPVEVYSLTVAHTPDLARPPLPLIEAGCACCRAVVVREPLDPVSRLLLGYHGASPAVEVRVGDCPAG